MFVVIKYTETIAWQFKVIIKEIRVISIHFLDHQTLVVWASVTALTWRPEWTISYNLYASFN